MASPSGRTSTGLRDSRDTSGCSSTSTPTRSSRSVSAATLTGAAPRYPNSNGAVRGARIRCAASRSVNGAARQARSPSRSPTTLPGPNPTSGPNAGSSTASTTNGTPGATIGCTTSSMPVPNSSTSSPAALDTAYASARSVRTAPRSTRCRSSRSATLTATGYPTSSAAWTACDGTTIRDGTSEIPYEVSRSGPSTVDSRGTVPAGERRHAAYEATRPSARTDSSTDGYAGTPGGGSSASMVTTTGLANGGASTAANPVDGDSTGTHATTSASTAGSAAAARSALPKSTRETCGARSVRRTTDSPAGPHAAAASAPSAAELVTTPTRSPAGSGW